jgi:hypothetical protein
MTIVNFWETELYFGAINDTASTSGEHNFKTPGVTVWSRPYLQSVSVTDGTVVLSVSQFTDKTGTHPGPFHPGIFATNCTNVKFGMFAENCVSHAVLTSEIWG